MLGRGVRFGMSLSLEEFADLLGETEADEETDEPLGDRLAGSVDADVDSVGAVRSVRGRE
jgi:hypothetical protein